MSEYNNSYNYNDSKIRSIIIAVLSKFQNILKIKQYSASNNFTEHVIPFFYSMTGSEDFILDNFMTSDYSELASNAYEGSYEPIPRGVLQMSSVEIDSGSMINRHVRTEIPKKVDNINYKMYSYETMIIPVNLSFEVKIVSNSNLEMLKIVEVLISNLYKVTNFKVDFGMYYVNGTIVLPESFDQEKLFEFTYSDKQKNEITFSIDVSTSIPVFDEKTEHFLGDKIMSIESNIYDIAVSPEIGIYSNSENGIVFSKEAMVYDKKEITK